MQNKRPYSDYCRPKLADLLSALKLDTEYVSATGCYLQDKDGRTALDLIGGFGATVLGHSHPVLVAGLIDDLRQNVPVHAQASSRNEAGRLAQRLSELTGVRKGYYVNFSNSGTEANEAAIKHAYKIHFDKVRREYERVTRILQDFYHQADGLGSALVLPNGQKKLCDFRDDLDEYNLAELEGFQNAPVVVALKGSFHGKTTSSLKVTFNKSYREPFEGLSSVRPIFLDLDAPHRLAEVVSDHTLTFLIPVLAGHQVELHEIRLTKVFAVILEVVLGEGGMRPVADQTLAALAEAVKKLHVPVILDEVQTGCGRIGAVFGYQLTPLAVLEPDYITLSKALGGGLVKIGAALIRKDVYDPDFGILHTSTFAEDELSSRAASRFLDLLTADREALLGEIRRKGENLLTLLRRLAQDFPEVVKDVRGRGLIIGIELKPLLDHSPFFRATGKQGILSLLVASYMLHHHGIRILAPLSSILKGNPGKERLSILRIQPAVTITDADVARLEAALREVFGIIRANNEYLLVAHLLGVEVPPAVRRDPPAFAPGWPVAGENSGHIDARTGFVVHPTRLDNIVEYYFPSASGQPFPMDALHRWWTAVCRFLEPVHARSTIVRSGSFVIENSLVFVPSLPDYLVGQTDPRLVQEVQDKIQDAVTIAREIGDENIPVCMVGLGAYTSIATRNGETINDYEVSVTTGNAYTVGLSILGIMRAAEERGIEMGHADAAVVGATGNIGMVIAQFLTLSVGRLVLLGRPGETGLGRLQMVRRECLDAVLRTIREERALGLRPEETEMTGIGGDLYRLIAPNWGTLTGGDGALAQSLSGERHSPKAGADLGAWLAARPEGEAILDRIRLATTLDAIADADIVAVSTNSPDGNLIRPDMIKPGSVVCCTSVPSNLSPLFRDHPDITAFDGGLARLPNDTCLDFVGMPGDGLSYGCVAETLVLGFEGSDHSYCKGKVNMEQVRQIVGAAASHGFSLGRVKLDRHVAPLAA